MKQVLIILGAIVCATTTGCTESELKSLITSPEQYTEPPHNILSGQDPSVIVVRECSRLNQSAAGEYNSFTRTISVCTGRNRDFAEDKMTLEHEQAHAYLHANPELGDYRNESYATKVATERMIAQGDCPVLQQMQGKRSQDSQYWEGDEYRDRRTAEACR